MICDTWKDTSPRVFFFASLSVDVAFFRRTLNVGFRLASPVEDVTLGFETKFTSGVESECVLVEGPLTF